MEDKTCACGKTFKRLKDGRCPHCGLRIVEKSMDTFSMFMAGELEEIAFVDDDKHVRYYYRDPEVKGPPRHGWNSWPSSFTPAQVKAIEAVQNIKF